MHRYMHTILCVFCTMYGDWEVVRTDNLLRNVHTTCISQCHIDAHVRAVFNAPQLNVVAMRVLSVFRQVYIECDAFLFAFFSTAQANSLFGDAKRRLYFLP